MNHAHPKKSHLLETATKHWKYVAPILACPKNERDYDKLVARLNELLDIVGDNEKHPLMSMVDALSHLISSYEGMHIKKSNTTGISALNYLIKSHQLSQSDFPEIASQGVMSEILNGKRSLNVRQIKLLAKRFHVDPSTFID